jgi:hypothetical protein
LAVRYVDFLLLLKMPAPGGTKRLAAGPLADELSRAYRQAFGMPPKGEKAGSSKQNSDWLLVTDDLANLEVRWRPTKHTQNNFLRGNVGETILIPILFWMYSKTTEIRRGCGAPRELARSAWKAAYGSDLDEALAVAGAASQGPTQLDAMAGKKWQLDCVGTDIPNPRFLAFELHAYQPPASTAGTLALYLDVQAARDRTIDDVEFAFEGISIKSIFKDSKGAETTYPEAHARLSPMGETATVERGGKPHAHYWDLTSTIGSLEGQIGSDGTELFAIRPSEEVLDFSAEMQTELKDLRLLKVPEGKTGTQATMLRSIFL